jgi:hypothetical protein
MNKKYFSKKELWLNQAPSFNFELGEDQLLEKALEVGFVSKVDEDKYLLNDSYNEFYRPYGVDVLGQPIDEGEK